MQAFIQKDELLSLIRAEVTQLSSHDNQVAKARRVHLEFLSSFLSVYGFPKNIAEKYKLSIHPLYFQETNYDDIDIYNPQANLMHLSAAYQIDFAVQTAGHKRELAPKEIFEDYSKNLGRFIAWRKGEKTLGDRLLLFFSPVRRG